MGVVRGTYLALEHMNKLTGGRGGVIVNTASMAGKPNDAIHAGYIVRRQHSVLSVNSENVGSIQRD